MSSSESGTNVGRLAQVSRRRPPVGTTFSFSLNERARATLRFSRLAPGVKLHGKCIHHAANTKQRPRCTQSHAAGTLTLAAHPGTNHVRFQGNLGPTRKLTPGHYTLTIAASDSAHQTTTSRALAFTIVR
jgi:hypothetical protein